MTAGHSRVELLFPTVNLLDRQGIRTEVCMQKGRLKSKLTYCTHDTQWAVGHPTLFRDSFPNLIPSKLVVITYTLHSTSLGQFGPTLYILKYFPFLFRSDTYVQIHL